MPVQQRQTRRSQQLLEIPGWREIDPIYYSGMWNSIINNKHIIIVFAMNYVLSDT